MSINFSVIIPHYNCPSLLERCLKSIPRREDVEVIIVDDHSSPDKVDFLHFPGLGRKNTKVIFCDGKSGNGPGYARNVGIQNASGKWVIFSDSDDFLLENLSGLMDRYLEDVSDVIYFKASKKMSDSDDMEDYEYFCEPLDWAVGGEDDELLYATPSPVAKFVKLDYIRKNGIRFQEVTGGDDILFSIALAKNTNKRKYVQESFYCVVMAPNSLTRGTAWQNYYNFVVSSCSAFKALKPLGRERYALIWIRSWSNRLFNRNIWRALSLIPLQIRTIGMKRALVNVKKGILNRYHS